MGKATVSLRGTDWIASSGTGLSVSYAGGASLGVQISHGLPDPLLRHVPVKKKTASQTRINCLRDRKEASKESPVKHATVEVQHCW